MANLAFSIEETGDELGDGSGTSTVSIKQRIELGNVEGPNEAGVLQYLHDQACVGVGDTTGHWNIDSRDKCWVSEVGIQTHMQHAAMFCDGLQNAPDWSSDAALSDLAY